MEEIYVAMDGTQGMDFEEMYEYEQSLLDVYVGKTIREFTEATGITHLRLNNLILAYSATSFKPCIVESFHHSNTMPDGKRFWYKAWVEDLVIEEMGGLGHSIEGLLKHIYLPEATISVSVEVTKEFTKEYAEYVAELYNQKYMTMFKATKLANEHFQIVE